MVSRQNRQDDIREAVPSDSVTGDSDVAKLCDDALALIEQGNYDEARARLTGALSSSPRDPLIYYRLGVLYGETKRFSEAMDAYDTAIALNAGDSKSHNNRGSVLQQLDRLEEAAEAFQRAIDLAPDLAPPYINLGNLRGQQGRPSEAIAVFQRAVDRGLDRGIFDQCISAISGTHSPRSPDTWVKATFDNFAPVFDEHLRSLGYAVPGTLARLLRRHGQGVTFEILDLGCGTGQCGLVLAGQSRNLVGVDLSQRMLALAEKRGVYDQLHHAEIHAWLRSVESAAFDVVIAADVFIYIGALEEIFSEVARVLRANGWFAFSIEQDDIVKYALRTTGRYAHAVDYIDTMAAAAFNTVYTEATTLRMESGVPVSGRLFLLQRA